MTSDKVYMVTGGNAGIGKRAALALAKQGATVIMLCRNPQRAKAAQQEIIEQSGNEKVELLIADMSSQQSIRDAVSEFKQNYSRLDGLINNAANFDITMKTPQLTEDGIETIFATNHLGIFLLTNLLLDTMKTSPSARILNVASKGLMIYPFLSIEFDNLNGEKKFSAQHAYYHSKLAQVMFTYDLAQRLKGTGITVNCVRVPAVRLDEGRYEHVPAAMRFVLKLKMRFALSAEAMAEAYVRLLTAPEFAEVSGQYFDENCKPVKSSGKSHNENVWQGLWEKSTELTQLQELVPA
jgi:NAD(P)-dependent dehydrogenase (short-subunit alcohol dehydrogenase family)